MAEETIEQMNRLLDGNQGALMDLPRMAGSTSDMEMQMMSPPKMRPEGMGAVSQAEMDMITSAQQGLMQMDPEGTKDIVQGMETTKARVAQGAGLTEPEFMGIKEILEKLSNALGGMMGGGSDEDRALRRDVELMLRNKTGAAVPPQEVDAFIQNLKSGGGNTMTYMVDGNPVEMTEREMMSAKNAGMMVQDMGSYQVDDRMEQMTPDTYADKVARGEITPDELMMESSGSTMTDAERAIRDNAEFNRRAQEEQEMMFRMNNPPVTSSVRPQLRSTQ